MTAVNDGQLFPAALAAGAALVVLVNAVVGEEFVFGQKRDSRFSCAEKPFPVEPEMERFVDGAGLLPYLAGPEGARLDDVIGQRQIRVRVVVPHIAAVCNCAVL